MKGPPRFSIVIPVFNREIELQRALDSCLGQDFEDFEVAVIDDYSSDSSYHVADTHGDPRIRVRRLSKNRGELLSRRIGVNLSRGEWVLCLDSDDELLPGALRCIAEVIDTAPQDICRIGFSYRLDRGGTSPFPRPHSDRADYRSFLRFLERSRLTDALWVTRRHTFLHPFGGGAVGQVHYHLDFARHFATLFSPLQVAMIHTDSASRQSHFLSNGNKETVLRRANSDLRVISQALETHGDQLRAHAPRYYAGLLRRMSLAGSTAIGRTHALHYAWEHCRMFPWQGKSWALLGCVGLGGSVPAVGRSMYQRLWEHRQHTEA